ncbi:MAG: hypothetical protein HUK26_04910, partial [Duodenibacillus sp.]|nr:hypothetical protein [Duodenibacillus sp.]
MQITSAEQLVQCLSASKHFKLEGGVLKTENALVHALKNVFSFASTIAERNAKVRGAMAEILAKEGLPDISKALVEKGAETPKHLLAEPARRSICQSIRERLHASAAAKETGTEPATQSEDDVRSLSLMSEDEELPGSFSAVDARPDSLASEKDLPGIAEPAAGKGGKASGKPASRGIAQGIQENLLAKVVAKRAGALPAGSRACAVRIATAVIKDKGLANDRRAADKFARQIMDRLAKDKNWQTVLGCGYRLSSSEMQGFFEDVAGDFRKTYLKQSGEHIKDGMHDSFLLDSARHIVRTINHTPREGGEAGAAASYEQLKALIPDPR